MDRTPVRYSPEGHWFAPSASLKLGRERMAKVAELRESFRQQRRGAEMRRASLLQAKHLLGRSYGWRRYLAEDFRLRDGRL